jgi:hypothetical protein
MKKSLLLISITICLGACTPPNPSQDSTPDASDTFAILMPINIDTDSVHTIGLEPLDTAEVVEVITPELKAAYAKVYQKMLWQRPEVQHRDDTFKYDLTPEEWAIYNKVNSIKAKSGKK